MPGQTIMLVDDSPSVRTLMRMALERAGYQVVEACDGEDAIDHLVADTPAGIVCDLAMPRLDGLGFLRYLRHHPRLRHVPLMLLTTETRPQIREQTRLQGAQAFLNKPCRPSELVAAVRRLVH
ncbi:MAG: response regulator [Burkholderiaceae bacterium]|nr:response regulator [Burkholderiaceae bacterium]